MNIGLQVLKAKLRGFHVAGLSISSRISRSSDERRARLWNAKRELGAHCRSHLIAYCLLRGVPYEKVERCAPNNRPNPQAVLDVMLEHVDRWQRRSLSLDAVKSMLEPSPCPPAAHGKTT